MSSTQERMGTSERPAQGGGHRFTAFTTHARCRGSDGTHARDNLRGIVATRTREQPARIHQVTPVFQRRSRPGIGTGLASSVSSSREATQTQGRNATQARTVREAKQARLRHWASIPCQQRPATGATAHEHSRPLSLYHSLPLKRASDLEAT